MDYSYIKRDVENEKNLGYKHFLEEYERKENEIIEYICDRIVEQVKDAVKQYYNASEEEKRRICMRTIKKPTLFRHNWLYESSARDVIYKVYEPERDIQILGHTNYYDCDVPYVKIPADKFDHFYYLLNQRLRRNDIMIDTKWEESWQWHEILITADIGKL